MHIDLARLVFFSPTRTTRAVTLAIGQGLAAGALSEMDITLPAGVPGVAIESGAEELTVFAAPVYAGRLPVEAVGRLRRFKGSGGPAVVVVVFGNRAYDDALLELRDLAVEQGFVPVAGAAFVGEHSFSSKEMPIAPGRPDKADLIKARSFGAAVAAKVKALESVEGFAPLAVPGNLPYRESGLSGGVAPTWLDDACVRCGLCTTVCPTGAITLEADGIHTDASRCLRCFACIRACPCDARVMEHEGVRQSAARLHANCQDRKEPEVYL